MISNRAAPEFQELVTITNRVATRFNGSRDTCVLTSFALHNVLQRLGYSSRQPKEKEPYHAKVQRVPKSRDPRLSQ
jgi:hypothetical protein